MLRANVFRPDDADGSPIAEPTPVVLNLTPYTKLLSTLASVAVEDSTFGPVTEELGSILDLGAPFGGITELAAPAARLGRMFGLNRDLGTAPHAAHDGTLTSRHPPARIGSPWRPVFGACVRGNPRRAPPDSLHGGVHRSLVASLRAIDDSKSTLTASGDYAQAYPTLTLETLRPVVPGETTQLDISTLPTDVVLKPGHRLRINVYASSISRSLPLARCCTTAD
jgi:hypothetical protein